MDVLNILTLMLISTIQGTKTYYSKHSRPIIRERGIIAEDGQFPYTKSSADETTRNSKEMDYETEESDETMQPILHTTWEYSSTYNTRSLRSALANEETSEVSSETDGIEETDGETETSRMYSIPKYYNTYRTTPLKSSSFIKITFTEQTSDEETNERDETIEFYDETGRSTLYTSPNKYSSTNTYKTVPLKSSTLVPTSLFVEQISEESSEIDETEGSTLYTTGKYFNNYRTLPFKSFILVPTTSLVEQTSEESEEIQEKIDKNNERAMLYTAPKYSTIYRTTHYKPFTPRSTTPFDKQTLMESNEIHETEGSACYTTPKHHSSNDRTLKSLLGPFKFYKPVTNNEIKETEHTDRPDKVHEIRIKTDEPQKSNTYSTHRTHKPLPSIISNETTGHTFPSNSYANKLQNTSTISAMNSNCSSAANEHSTNNANNSYSESIPSISVKLIPSYYTSIFCYFGILFVTKKTCS